MTDKKDFEETYPGDTKLDLDKPDGESNIAQEYPNTPSEATTAEAAYRYYCEACSGTAFHCATKDIFQDRCNVCGATLIRKEENYIPL